MTLHCRKWHGTLQGKGWLVMAYLEQRPTISPNSVCRACCGGFISKADLFSKRDLSCCSCKRFSVSPWPTFVWLLQLSAGAGESSCPFTSTPVVGQHASTRSHGKPLRLALTSPVGKREGPFSAPCMALMPRSTLDKVAQPVSIWWALSGCHAPGLSSSLILPGWAVHWSSLISSLAWPFQCCRASINEHALVN